MTNYSAIQTTNRWPVELVKVGPVRETREEACQDMEVWRKEHQEAWEKAHSGQVYDWMFHNRWPFGICELPLPTYWSCRVKTS